MSATDNTVDDEGLTTALRESPFNRRRDLPHAVVVVPPDEDLVLDPQPPDADPRRQILSRRSPAKVEARKRN